MNKIRELKDIKLGEWKVDKLELIENESKVLDPTKSKLIYEFEI